MNRGTRIHARRAVAVAVIVAFVFALLIGWVPSPVEAASVGWSKLDLGGYQINELALDLSAPTTMYAGTAGNGAFRSTNGGQSWQAASSGLSNRTVNALSIDPTNPAVLLAGTGRGPLVGEPNAGVYRSTNRGASWSPVLTGVASMAVSRATQSPWLVYSAGAGIWKSADGGATWSRLTLSGDAIQNVDFSGIAVSPWDPNVVVAVGNTEGGTGRVFRSADGGASWVLVLDNLAPVFGVTFALPTASTATALVAGAAGAWRSTDNGVSFQLVTQELGNVSVNHVAFDPVSTTIAYGATSQGVVRGINNANDWSAMPAISGGPNVRTVVVSAVSHTLYAGTDSGVWAYTAPSIPNPIPIRPSVSWYFAEGSTQPPFDTWFLVFNPTSASAAVRFTFELQGGGIQTRDVTVGPTSRFSLYANQAIPNAAFSTRIDANVRVFAERSMYVGYDGDVVPGIAAPSATWSFAEGSTQSPFQTWFLLQNPNDATVTATMTYLLADGSLPRTQTLILPPLSRTSVFANQVLPNSAFASRIDSSLPIVAERAMYRFPGNAATASSGATAPSTTWYFPNAHTSNAIGSGRSGPFDAWLLLQNPNAQTVTALVKLLQPDGTIVSFAQTVAPFSRQSVWLNQTIANGSFGVEVDATAPVIAERSHFFGPEPRGAETLLGATSLATEWFLAEGSTQPPFSESLFILNPTVASMAAHVDYELPGGQVIGRDYTVGPTRALTVNVADVVPNSAVSIHVTTSLPSAVERQMYFTKLGALGGTDALGER